ncbi:MAG: carbamoyl-phosphate synthase (glutamine-hydrolyzing) large subunit [Candidatus Brockarchaeota archaeon]|nr:carbamoyl-phosphate synthase (glutamine-hydrolyzing) large subunit [Candidatus Brockarchaeota archaeon]
MPRMSNIRKALVIGSGGIVIAQAAEFDYSGSQALKALKEDGIETIIVNPNIATIQTSRRMADKVYLEPLTVDSVSRIIEKEGVDGILLGFGGQTALNLGLALHDNGVLDKYGVKVLGCSIETIRIAEDRDLFRRAMLDIGLKVPPSGVARSPEDAVKVSEELGFPLLVRTSFTLGGQSSGIVKNRDELYEAVSKALRWSLNGEVLIERSYFGWKELEYEYMRDYYGNAVAVATMEGFDPLGVHTGEKIVVVPIQTLTNKEYHRLRTAGLRIVEKLGIVGECNIQFGLDPESGELIVVEVNPRLSRSSALASKATGYPLAYLAAKLAIGYRIDEITNKVTGITKASFEPALDYVVVKYPRWDFRKFPGDVDRTIGTMMKSVGEVMAIGRTFEEALQKAVRMLQIGKIGVVGNEGEENGVPSELSEFLKPTDERLFNIVRALKAGVNVEEISRVTGIDKWFLYRILNIIRMDSELNSLRGEEDEEKIVEKIKEAKRLGFSDIQIAKRLGWSEDEVRSFRIKHGIKPVFKLIDTMAAEWESVTNYLYATYGDETSDISEKPGKRKVIILGAGTNRIGSSVEFDYCTMHTVWSMKEEGFDEVIVINNNPETVSTDYDMSDKLYFEELSFERVMDIVEAEKPEGVIVSVGGQDPINITPKLHEYNVRILGTSPVSIDRAEDRAKFSLLLDKLGIKQPPWTRVSSIEEAVSRARVLGYPVLVRPSYVLSGAAMNVAANEEELVEYIRNATKISPEHSVVISKFFEQAYEAEVDAVSDGEDVLIGGVMEHVEYAGTHSGDATIIIPPQRLPESVVERIKDYTVRIARELQIIGPFNIQYLVKNSEVYVIEANVRASRTMPFVSKVTGIPLIWLAGKVMAGRKLREFSSMIKRNEKTIGVKVPVFSFVRLKGVDPVLGVEMRSTGEVACIGYDFIDTFVRAWISSGLSLPSRNSIIFITVRDEDKPGAAELAKRLVEMGFTIAATRGTRSFLSSRGFVNVMLVNRLSERVEEGVDSMSFLTSGRIGLVINTPDLRDKETLRDMYVIRRTAVEFAIPVVTSLEVAERIIEAMRFKNNNASAYTPCSLDEFHKDIPLSKYV